MHILLNFVRKVSCFPNVCIFTISAAYFFSASLPAKADEATGFPMYIMTKGGATDYWYHEYLSYWNGYMDYVDGYYVGRTRTYQDNYNDPWRVLLIEKGQSKGLVQFRRDEHNGCLTYMEIGGYPADFAVIGCDRNNEMQLFQLIPSSLSDGAKHHLYRTGLRKGFNQLDLSKEREYQIYLPAKNVCVNRRDNSDIIAWPCKKSGHSDSHHDKFIFAPADAGIRQYIQEPGSRRFYFNNETFYLGRIHSAHSRPQGYLSYDNEKLALWSDMAVMYHFDQHRNGKTSMVRSSTPMQNNGYTLDPEPMLSGYSSALFRVMSSEDADKFNNKDLLNEFLENKGATYFTNQTASTQQIRLMQTGSISRTVGYSYSAGMSTSYNFSVSIGGSVKGVNLGFEASVGQQFDTNETWKNDATNQNIREEWITIDVLPGESVWKPVIYTGKRLTSQWNIELINGTHYQSLPFSLVIRQYTDNGIAVCSSNGIAKELKKNGKPVKKDGIVQLVYTGSYPPGDPCLISWPKSVTMKRNEVIKQVRYAPADHIYRGEETGDAPQYGNGYKKQPNPNYNYVLHLDGKSRCLVHPHKTTAEVHSSNSLSCSDNPPPNHQWNFTLDLNNAFYKICTDKYSLCLGLERDSNNNYSTINGLPKVVVLDEDGCKGDDVVESTCMWAFDSEGKLHNMGTKAYFGYCLQTHNSYSNNAVLGKCNDGLQHKIEIQATNNIIDRYAESKQLVSLRLNAIGSKAQCLNAQAQSSDSLDLVLGVIEDCNSLQTNKWRVSNEIKSGEWVSICNSLNMCLKEYSFHHQSMVKATNDCSFYANKNNIDTSCLWRFDSENNMFINRANSRCLTYINKGKWGLRLKHCQRDKRTQQWDIVENEDFNRAFQRYSY